MSGAFKRYSSWSCYPLDRSVFLGGGWRACAVRLGLHHIWTCGDAGKQGPRPSLDFRHDLFLVHERSVSNHGNPRDHPLAGGCCIVRIRCIGLRARPWRSIGRTALEPSSPRLLHGRLLHCLGHSFLCRQREELGGLARPAIGRVLDDSSLNRNTSDLAGSHQTSPFARLDFKLTDYHFIPPLAPNPLFLYFPPPCPHRPLEIRLFRLKIH